MVTFYDAISLDEMLIQENTAALLSSQTNIFQNNMLENFRIAEPLHGIKYLDAGQTAFGVIVGSNAFRQMLSCDRRIDKPDVQDIHLTVVSNFHGDLLKNHTVYRNNNDLFFFFDKNRAYLFRLILFSVPLFAEFEVHATIQPP